MSDLDNVQTSTLARLQRDAQKSIVSDPNKKDVKHAKDVLKVVKREIRARDGQSVGTREVNS